MVDDSLFECLVFFGKKINFQQLYRKETIELLNNN